MTTTALKIYEKWKEIQIGDYFHLIPWNCQINDNTYLVDGKIVHVDSEGLIRIMPFINLEVLL